MSKYQVVNVLNFGVLLVISGDPSEELWYKSILSFDALLCRTVCRVMTIHLLRKYQVSLNRSQCWANKRTPVLLSEPDRFLYLLINLATSSVITRLI